MGAGPAGGNQGGGGSKASNKKAKKDLEVSGYEAAITKQNKGTKKEINKGLNITTSSNDNKRSGYKPADYNIEKDDTGIKKSKPKSTLQKIADKSPVLNLLKNNPLSKKALEVNTKFYNEKVVPAGKSTAPNYETYMKDRLAGKTDAYGNKTARDNDGGNNNTPTVKVASIPKVTTAPTEAEVSQSAATDATAVAETKKVDDIYTRKKKSKARGRSMMTLTSAQGLKKDDNLVLGKRSLLGSVV